MKEGPLFSASIYIRRLAPSSAGASAFARNWKVDTQTKKLGKSCLFSETGDRSLSIGLGYGALWLLRSLPSSLPNLTIYPWDNQPGKRQSSWAARFSSCVLCVMGPVLQIHWHLSEWLLFPAYNIDLLFLTFSKYHKERSVLKKNQ